SQSLRQWLIDQIKSIGVSFCLFLILFLISYAALISSVGKLPWWFVLGTVINVVSVLVSFLVPVVIVPIFFHYAPLANESLKKKISDICRKFGFPINEVSVINFSAKTNKANAFFCGLGQTRRVVLADTLVNNFTDDEIETVVVHELGHLRHHDILKSLILK